MKTRFPTSMVMLAAVVAVGMVGSQLGGLSGQAAGGESAGCGGDAYYDEDLGELVDSEGNVVDESGEAGASGSDEQVAGLVTNFRPIPAGSAVPGNELVRILEPNTEAASDLAADSAGTAQFVARADIDIDGRYAMVGWGASEEGYEDLSHIQVFENRNGQWWMLNELPADRDRATPMRSLDIIHVTSDNKIYLAVDSHALVYDILNNRWSPTPVQIASDTLFERFNNGLEMRLADDEFNANYTIKADVSAVLSSEDSDWTNELVETVIGQARFQARTAISNDLVIGTDASAALLVGACEYGDEPAMGDDGVLYCDACQSGMCFNPLNTLNVLEIAPEERQVLRVDLRDNFIARLALRIEAENLERMRNPLAIPAGFAEAIERGEKWSGGDNVGDKTLWNISQAAYKDNGAPSGWYIWKTCNVENSTAKFVYQYPTVAITFSGTDGLSEWGDWQDNLNTSTHVHEGQGFHAGFYNYQNRLAGCLRDGVDQLKGWGIEIDYIVGHSLGGAAATVYANVNYILHDDGGWPKLVTFGAPKTRTDAECAEPGERFAHHKDPIAGRAMGMMDGFNHDVTNATKALSAVSGQECGFTDWWGNCWWWRDTYTNTTTSQHCNESSDDGCRWYADCAYNFATIHKEYGSYLTD